MKVPIPDDWGGEDWFCVQIQWPDSPKWTAVLMGLLSVIEYGRFWDERTGTIKDAQSVARDIHYRNLPFAYCCTDTGDNPIDNVVEGLVIDPCEIGAIIMECSIPYGVLRWNGGVLEYRYCGEWYQVSGDIVGSGTSVPQPGDEDELELPSGTSDATSCSKATAITDVLFGIVDELLDSAEVPEVPWLALQRVGSRFPYISFGQTELLSAYMSALSVRAQGYSSEAEASDVQQLILCRASSVISAGNQGLTESERADVQSMIADALGGYFTVWTYPTVHADVLNMYIRSYRAIGANDTIAITSYATPTGEEDCDCPSDPNPVNLDLPTTPTDEGYYLSANLVENPYGVVGRSHPNAPSQTYEYFLRTVANRPIRGFAFRLSGTLNWHTDAYLGAPTPPDTVNVSLSSLHTTRESADVVFGAYAGSGLNATLDSIAANWNGGVTWDLNLGFPGNSIGTPSYGAYELLGFRWQNDVSGTNVMTVEEFRFILHTDDDP